MTERAPIDVSQARFPGQAPIDAYGNGGFRFADMSHRGSIICLPAAIIAWSATTAENLAASDLADVLTHADGIDLLLLGTGAKQVFPSPQLRSALRSAGITVEAMATGAACRTYNVLLAERRPVAAALIAVA